MDNWQKIPSGDWINLDYITQLTVGNALDKWYILGHIAGQERSFLMSEPFDTEEEGREYLKKQFLWYA